MEIDWGWSYPSMAPEPPFHLGNGNKEFFCSFPPETRLSRNVELNFRVCFTLCCNLQCCSLLSQKIKFFLVVHDKIM